MRTFIIILFVAFAGGRVAASDYIKIAVTANPTNDFKLAIATNDVRFVGYMGYALVVPGVTNYYGGYDKSNGVKIIAGTSDVVSPTSFPSDLADRYASAYNALLLQYEFASARDFAGIGVQLRAEGQNIVVNRILPDTPAAAQNDLHVGDRIVAVAQGQEPAVQVQSIMQAARSIRGPKGTTVRLTIIPAGEDDARVLSFVRGEVELPWGDGLLLATGTKAPDIEMVEVANKAGERLSNYAGKIIILEFWATWCGPCQTKMAKLQSYPGEYLAWKGNVVLIAASIDDSAEVVAQHLKTKGWDQTHNVWVKLSAIRAYHIGAIPTVYVISRQGKIVAVNPPDLPQVVNHELEEK